MWIAKPPFQTQGPCCWEQRNVTALPSRFESLAKGSGFEDATRLENHAVGENRVVQGRAELTVVDGRTIFERAAA